jgi:hypothetical protein
MPVRLSALSAGGDLPLRKIPVRGWVNPRATVRLEGLGKLKNQWLHRKSKPLPFGLWRSASTNYSTARKILKQILKAKFYDLRRMPSPGMLRSVALVTTDVSEERTASIIMLTRRGELGTFAVTSNRNTLRTMRFSETSVLTRSTLRHIPEDDIFRCTFWFRWMQGSELSSAIDPSNN